MGINFSDNETSVADVKVRTLNMREDSSQNKYNYVWMKYILPNLALAPNKLKVSTYYIGSKRF